MRNYYSWHFSIDQQGSYFRKTVSLCCQCRYHALGRSVGEGVWHWYGEVVGIVVVDGVLWGIWR